LISRRLEFKKPSWVGQPDKKRKDAFLSYLVLFPLLFVLISPTCFAEIINSRAAITIDASTGEILFSKNPNLRLPPASTTKLMTAIVAMESENLSKVVTISKNASHTAPSKRDSRKETGSQLKDSFMRHFSNLQMMLLSLSLKLWRGPRNDLFPL